MTQKHIMWLLLAGGALWGIDLVTGTAGDPNSGVLFGPGRPLEGINRPFQHQIGKSFETNIGVILLAVGLGFWAWKRWG